MKYTIQPTKEKGWVALNEETDESSLAKKIREADIILADLDGTDTSSGYSLVLYSLNQPEFFSTIKFWKYLAKSAYLYAKKRKKSESEIWKNWINTFYRDKSHLKNVREMYTPKFANSELYKGVREFYDTLRGDALRVYVSRNLDEVIEAFSKTLAFNDFFAEQFNKKDSVKQILERFPHRKRFIVKGDTAEDEEMFDELKYWKKVEQINDVYFINIANHERNYNPRADVNSSRNQLALAEWLKQY